MVKKKPPALKGKKYKYGARYGDVKFIKALKASEGRIYSAARRLGCTPKAVYDAMNRNPKIAEVAKEAKEFLTDTAEEALAKQIRAGEGWAICFYLKTQAKDRGYIERPDILQPVQQNFTFQQRQEEMTDNVYERITQLMGALMAAGRLSLPASVIGGNGALTVNGSNGYDDGGQGEVP